MLETLHKLTELQDRSQDELIDEVVRVRQVIHKLNETPEEKWTHEERVTYDDLMAHLVSLRIAQRAVRQREIERKINT